MRPSPGSRLFACIKICSLKRESVVTDSRVSKPQALVRTVSGRINTKTTTSQVRLILFLSSRRLLFLFKVCSNVTKRASQDQASEILPASMATGMLLDLSAFRVHGPVLPRITRRHGTNFWSGSCSSASN